MKINPKEEAVLKLIKKDLSYENYFFKKVKDAKWFYPLKKLGYFDPSKNPINRPAKDKGYFIIPQWNILDYLERISKQASMPENEGYIEELIKIIKKVSLYKNKEGKNIDNYHTWWYFVKILSNLPNNKISIETISLIQIWLRSKFGGSHVDADIVKILLPKFLYEGAKSDDLKKAEKLVDYITDFIWIKRKGFFSGEEEESLGVVEKHWLINSFIEGAMAKKVGKLCSINIVYILANKLKTIIKNKPHNNWLDVDDKKITYRFSIELDKDNVYLCTIGTYYKKKKDKKEEFLQSYIIKPKELCRFLVIAKNLESFSKQIKEKIGDIKIPKNVKKEIKNNIKNTYFRVYEDYSYIWLKDLFNTTESNLYEFKHIILGILTDVILEKAISDPLSTKKIIEEFIYGDYKHNVFTRLALIVITNNWYLYKEFFWKLFSSKGRSLLEEPAFEIDMRKLLKLNIGNFNKSEKEKINKFIINGPKKYLQKDNREKYIMYWKQRWLGVLKTDPYFTKQYKLIKSISKLDDDKRESGETGWVGPGTSPITEDKIFSTNNKKLAEIINKFKQKDLFSSESTAEGLATNIENVVGKHPEKFVEDLGPFIDTGYYYVSHILSGLKIAWKNKIIFDWNKALVFIQKYINRTEFWENKLSASSGIYNATSNWIIGNIGELIQEGVSDDEWSIPVSNFIRIKEIFLIIANKAQEKEIPKDFPQHVINCGWGKCIIGLVYLTLRIARINKGGKTDVWDKELKSIFEIYLKRKMHDAYTILGEHLINFSFLNKKWTEEQILMINKSKNEKQWEAFMSGYLASNIVNLELYKLMKRHYIEGLSFKFEESMLNNRLIDHIGIAYLNNIESIDKNGLLALLWEEWDVNHITALIDYFWSQRDSLTENKEKSRTHSNMRQKIIDFWEKIYIKLSKKNKPFTIEDEEILSDVIKLATFITALNDKNYHWIMLSARYVENRYNSTFLFERLNFIKNKGIKSLIGVKIAKIFLEVLKTYQPTYDPSDIHSIVEFLFRINNPEISKYTRRICNIYAEKGIDIVNKIYDQYNS